MAKGLGISGILNRESMAMAQGTHTVSYVDIQKIREHEKNRQFHQDKIEALAREIEDQGLQSPVVVAAAGNDNYLMISGHRRLAAFRFLADEGKEIYQVIPAIIRTGLSEQQIEEMLYDGNLFTEMPTDAELAAQLAWKKKRLLERKAAGEKIPGKLLDLIAEELGINPEAARRMDTINRRAIEVVKQKFEAGDMSLREAFKLSQLPSEQQTEMIQRKLSGETNYLFPERRVVRVPPEQQPLDEIGVVRVPPEQQSADIARYQEDIQQSLRLVQDLMQWVRETGRSEELRQHLYAAHAELVKFQIGLNDINEEEMP